MSTWDYIGVRYDCLSDLDRFQEDRKTVNGNSIKPIPALAILLALAATACEPPQSPPTVNVVDSAGVRVVDLGPAPLEPAEQRTLAAEPDLVIGSGEDDRASVLSDVRDVELLPGGRVAVVNGSGNQILVFDDAGRHVDTWGGTGDGPGEFRYLEWLAVVPPDSLAAGDGGLRRVSIFDAAGRHVRNRVTTSAVEPESRPIPPRPMGMLADGSLVAASFAQPRPVEGTARPPVGIVAIPSTGAAVHPLGTWPGEEVAIFREDGLLEVTQPPFGRRLHIAPAPDGVWIADDDQWEVRQYSGEGDLRMVVRSSAVPAAVTDELLEELIAERYRYADQVPTLEDLKQDQRRIARHTATPSLGVIRGMTDGGVAIGEFRLGTASPRTWITVDPNGIVSTVALPASFDVKRWGPDWVVAVVRDALDREEVHRYRIVGAGAHGHPPD